jgi:hypothetical protein
MLDILCSCLAGAGVLLLLLIVQSQLWAAVAGRKRKNARFVEEVNLQAVPTTTRPRSSWAAGGHTVILVTLGFGSLSTHGNRCLVQNINF